MGKFKIKKECSKCKGWGKERLSSIYFIRGMIIDCDKCNGKGYIEEIVEIMEVFK